MTATADNASIHPFSWLTLREQAVDWSLSVSTCVEELQIWGKCLPLVGYCGLENKKLKLEDITCQIIGFIFKSDYH